MRVLSLFDGISCGRVALERAGIPVTEYYACEIDKWAIQIAQKNYPDTIQLGSVTDIQGWMLPKIDLLIGGSPCQGFSFAGKQGAFEDPRSALFWEYVRLLGECKPRWFLLENVKMKKCHVDVISASLGVEPIEINSALVSAQNRKRLYWTNIPGVGQPEDRGILLRDIVHENVDAISQQELSACTPEGNAYALTATYYKGPLPSNSYEKHQRTMLWQTLPEYIVPFDKTLRILEKEVERGKVGYFRKDSQANRIYYIHDKAVCLTGEGGGGAAKMGQYLFGNIDCMAVREPGFLNVGKNTGNRFKADGKAFTQRGVRSGALFGCITPDRVDKRQNGQRFNDGKKFYTLTAQDQHGVLIEGYIRKLTPIECERLQTLPDNYTEVVETKYHSLYIIEEIRNGEVKLCNAKLKGVKERLIREDTATSVFYIINDLKDMEVLSYLKSFQIKNVNTVIERLGKKEGEREECVIDITKIGLGTATPCIQTKLGNDLKKMDIKNVLTVKLCTDKYMRITLEEDSHPPKSYIMSILIKLIIELKIFTYVKHSANILFCIESLRQSQGNLLRVELSDLRMESTISNSNTQRYKTLGNGWTVDVIAHIFKEIQNETGSI